MSAEYAGMAFDVTSPSRDEGDESVMLVDWTASDGRLYSVPAELLEKPDRSAVLNAATVEAIGRYSSRLVEDYDGDRYDEDEYGYDATARQAFVDGALWQAGVRDE